MRGDAAGADGVRADQDANVGSGTYGIRGDGIAVPLRIAANIKRTVSFSQSIAPSAIKETAVDLAFGSNLYADMGGSSAVIPEGSCGASQPVPPLAVSLRTELPAPGLPQQRVKTLGSEAEPMYEI
jgi:hypothetical protein